MFDSVSVLCIVASPAMRGSTPLDVAASSVMDNNGLALALEEPDLDKVRLNSDLHMHKLFLKWKGDKHFEIIYE